MKRSSFMTFTLINNNSIV